MSGSGEPGGPTNFIITATANRCASLARAILAHDLLSEDDRACLRANLWRRATDPWNRGEVRQA